MKFNFRYMTATPPLHYKNVIIKLLSLLFYLPYCFTFDSRGYLIPYTADGRTLVRAGVSVDAAARNIGEWKVKQ